MTADSHRPLCPKIPKQVSCGHLENFYLRENFDLYLKKPPRMLLKSLSIVGAKSIVSFCTAVILRPLKPISFKLSIKLQGIGFTNL